MNPTNNTVSRLMGFYFGAMSVCVPSLAVAQVSGTMGQDSPLRTEERQSIRTATQIGQDIAQDLVAAGLDKAGWYVKTQDYGSPGILVYLGSDHGLDYEGFMNALVPLIGEQVSSIGLEGLPSEMDLDDLTDFYFRNYDQTLDPTPGEVTNGAFEIDPGKGTMAEICSEGYRTFGLEDGWLLYELLPGYYELMDHLMANAFSHEAGKYPGVLNVYNRRIDHLNDRLGCRSFPRIPDSFRTVEGRRDYSAVCSYFDRVEEGYWHLAHAERSVIVVESAVNELSNIRGEGLPEVVGFILGYDHHPEILASCQRDSQSIIFIGNAYLDHSLEKELGIRKP
ncbi:MAG: hypothetical protein V1735_00340 [Nanoarchaeota archaeon]